jgi:hypothetical protein
MELVERVAKWGDRSIRQALGFDIEKCVRLKFPPARVESVACDLPPFRISKSDVLPNDRTRWLVSKNAGRSEGLHVQRGHEGDAYSIDDIRYTHYYNHLTGEVRVYHDDTRSFEEWVSTAHIPVPVVGLE